MFPEIKVVCTEPGIEAAKNIGNSLYARGSIDEAVSWFSKCLWLIHTKRVADISPKLRGILHSNRALAFLKLEKWTSAEDDGTAALDLDAHNTKARYRRAQALMFKGSSEGCLKPTC